MLTEEQFPWTTVYGLQNGPFKSRGATAEALKRYFGRVGQLDWRDYNQVYTEELWNLVADLKIRVGIRTKSQPRDGSYGKQVWEHIRKIRVPRGRPHAGEYALDLYSRKIVQDEAGYIATQTDLAKVQRYIVEFWNIAIQYNDRWHYSQARPLDVSVDPAAGGRSDCSMMPIQAHNYAGRKSGVRVPDPSKQSWSGYGNTDWYLDDWPKIGSPFRVGDLMHFHSDRHVIECIKPGNFDTAVWASNGSEAAPERINGIRTYYRFPDEYMFTVRPALTQEELV